MYGANNRVNANIYLVPASETAICSDLVNANKYQQAIAQIPEEYFMGYADSYSASTGEKEVLLRGLNVSEDGEYYLVVASNGVNENYVPTSSGGKYYYELGICSFTLDKSEVTAITAAVDREIMQIGDEGAVTSEITRGENTYSGAGNVTWTSLNPSVATVDATTGEIIGISEGNATIKASFGEIESEVSVAVIDQNKAEYVYNFGGSYLINPVTSGSVSLDFLSSMKFYDVNLSVSAPWKYILNKSINGYSMYAKAVESSFTAAGVGVGFSAYSIYVPKAGEYNLSVKKYTHSGCGTANIYIAPNAPIYTSTVVPSSSGPVTEEHLVGDVSLYGEGYAQTPIEDVGKVTIPSAGEYLLVVIGADKDATTTMRYNYSSFILTLAEDSDITDAFETETPVVTEYSPSVSGAGFTMGESSETVEGITETKQADGSYKMYAPENNGEYKFLYWAKGLSLNKKILSYENEFYYTPSGGDNNILIAVYDVADSETNKAEFYNANGQLVKLVKDDSTDKTVPALPSMAGFGNAASWKQYKGEVEYTSENVGSEVELSGTMIFVAQYEESEPSDVTVTVVNGSGSTTVPYGEKVTCTADSSKGELKWWKKTVGNTSEIVSIEDTYSFLAWEDCTITAEYAESKPLYTGSTAKIVLDTFAAGDATAVMAEFIGFGAGTVEKGIIYNGTKIAMTRPGNQFTVTGENGDVFKGYAIVKDGDAYNLIVDGVVEIND
ncbi:MAG: Ig-like domain-containing protein [Oscillospiraceae bacterium]|nr:Ig-like domain-containing protein [Oscillospiraceae bacterium]